MNIGKCWYICYMERIWKEADVCGWGDCRFKRSNSPVEMSGEQVDTHPKE